MNNPFISKNININNETCFNTGNYLSKLIELSAFKNDTYLQLIKFINSIIINE